MSTHNPYAWMTAHAARWWRSEEAKSKKPNLTLITTNQSTMEERNQEMSASDTQQSDDICRMLDGQPLSKHRAFADIEEAQRLLSMGSNALKGIGAMMLPGTNAEDVDTSAKRLELSEIFSFFGEVMAEQSQLISDAVFRIEQTANGRSM